MLAKNVARGGEIQAPSPWAWEADRRSWASGEVPCFPRDVWSRARDSAATVARRGNYSTPRFSIRSVYCDRMEYLHRIGERDGTCCRLRYYGQV